MIRSFVVRDNEKKLTRLILFFSAILFLALFYISGVRNFIVDRFNAVLAPLVSPVLNLNAASDKKINALQQENAQLLQENSALAEKLKIAEALIKDTSPINGYKPAKKIMAKVVWVNLLPGKRMIHINKGKQDGIAQGMAAVSGTGALVGRVTNVLDTSADIILLDDATFTTSVEIGSFTKNAAFTTGLLKGTRSGSPIISLVGVDASIEKDMMVQTAGQGDTIPEGIAIGRVEDVSVKGAEPFLNITVKPFVDITQEQYIFVIL